MAHASSAMSAAGAGPKRAPASTVPSANPETFSLVEWVATDLRSLTIANTAIAITPSKFQRFQLQLSAIAPTAASTTAAWVNFISFPGVRTKAPDDELLSMHWTYRRLGRNPECASKLCNFRSSFERARPINAPYNEKRSAATDLSQSRITHPEYALSLLPWG